MVLKSAGAMDYFTLAIIGCQLGLSLATVILMKSFVPTIAWNFRRSCHKVCECLPAPKRSNPDLKASTVNKHCYLFVASALAFFCWPETNLAFMMDIAALLVLVIPWIRSLVTTEEAIETVATDRVLRNKRTSMGIEQRAYRPNMRLLNRTISEKMADTSQPRKSNRTTRIKSIESDASGLDEELVSRIFSTIVRDNSIGLPIRVTKYR